MTESDKDALANLLDDGGQTCLKRQSNSSADTFGINFWPHNSSRTWSRARYWRRSCLKFTRKKSARKLSGLGQGADCIENLRSFKGLLDDCVATGSLRLGFIKRLQQSGRKYDPNCAMSWIGLDPVTYFVARAIGQKNVGNHHIGRETIQRGIHELTIGGQFNLKAFFDQNASTDTLGVRAVIGQEYS